MNKRLEKKRAKQFCNKERIGNWQCVKCGWDSHQDTSHRQVSITDGMWKTIRCKCPVCGNSFSYIE